MEKHLVSYITGDPRRRMTFVYCSIVSLAPLLFGCGGGPDTTTVRGKVTYKGAPVTYGLINFSTGSGQPIGGTIQPDGSYEYQLPPGEYRVRVDAPEKVPEAYKEGDPQPPPSPRLVPEKFADFEASGLTATIGGESPQQLDFKLP